MAAAPEPKLSFDHLPKVVQEEVSSFLPAEDLQALSAVSNVFNKIINNPALWEKVAKKLNVKVTAGDPKQNVLAYYRASNNALLEFFSINGHKIQEIPEDIFLQRQAIEKYFKLYVRDPDLLNTAARLGNTEVVKFLIEAKVPIDVNCSWVAARDGYTEIVKLFIQAKVPMHKDCLYWASNNGHTEIVKLLIQAKAPMHKNCLYWAVIFGHTEIVKLLIDAKAPMADDILATAAGKRGKIEIVQLLLADPRCVPTQADVTEAERHGHHDIAALLLKALE